MTFDYNHKLDIQVLTGPGASCQLSGILNVAGINALTYMDATPGTPLIRVLQEVLSGTLQVRFQLYNDVAVLPQRRPKGSPSSAPDRAGRILTLVTGRQRRPLDPPFCVGTSRRKGSAGPAVTPCISFRASWDLRRSQNEGPAQARSSPERE